MQGPTLHSRLSLYPNPASGQFFLHHPGVAVDRVQLMNAFGQLVRSWEKPEENKVFSLHGLAPGPYMVKVQAGAEVRSGWLVVK